MMLFTIVLVIAVLVYSVVAQHANKKQQSLMQNIFVSTISNMNSKNAKLFDDFSQRLTKLETLVTSQQYEINRLQHTVKIQSHIISSVSPRIKYKSS